MSQGYQSPHWHANANGVHHSPLACQWCKTGKNNDQCINWHASVTIGIFYPSDITNIYIYLYIRSVDGMESEMMVTGWT